MNRIVGVCTVSLLTRMGSVFSGPSAISRFKQAERLWTRVIANSDSKDVVSLSQEAQKSIVGLKVEKIDTAKTAAKGAYSFLDTTIYLDPKSKDARGVFAHEFCHACQHYYHGFGTKVAKLLSLCSFAQQLAPEGPGLRSKVVKILGSFSAAQDYAQAYTVYNKIEGLDSDTAYKKMPGLLKGLSSNALKQLKQLFLQELQADRLSCKNRIFVGSAQVHQDRIQRYNCWNRFIRSEQAERLTGDRFWKIGQVRKKRPATANFPE